MKQILQSLKTGETVIEDIPCPKNTAGALLIETTKSLVSAGTERMLVEFGKASLLGKIKQQPDKVKMVLEKIKTAVGLIEGAYSVVGSVADDYIFASYSALMAAAGWTFCEYYVHLKRNWVGLKSFKEKFFRTAFGICGVAFFTFTNRGYFQSWKGGSYVGLDTDFMLSHEMVLFNIFCLTIFYLYHTGTIKYDVDGFKTLIKTSTLTFIVFLYSLWFTQHNEWAERLVSWLIYW